MDLTLLSSFVLSFQTVPSVSCNGKMWIEELKKILFLLLMVHALKVHLDVQNLGSVAYLWGRRWQ